MTSTADTYHQAVQQASSTMLTNLFNKKSARSLARLMTRNIRLRLGTNISNIDFEHMALWQALRTIYTNAGLYNFSRNKGFTNRQQNLQAELTSSIGLVPTQRSTIADLEDSPAKPLKINARLVIKKDGSIVRPDVKRSRVASANLQQDTMAPIVTGNMEPALILAHLAAAHTGVELSDALATLPELRTDPVSKAWAHNIIFAPMEAFAPMRLLRRALYHLGFDIEMRIVRRDHLFVRGILTADEQAARRVGKITGILMNKKNMWKTLATKGHNEDDLI